MRKYIWATIPTNSLEDYPVHNVDALVKRKVAFLAHAQCECGSANAVLQLIEYCEYYRNDAREEVLESSPPRRAEPISEWDQNFVNVD